MTITLPIQPNLPLNVTFIFKKIEKVFQMLEKKTNQPAIEKLLGHKICLRESENWLNTPL